MLITPRGGLKSERTPWDSAIFEPTEFVFDDTAARAAFVSYDLADVGLNTREVLSLVPCLCVSMSKSLFVCVCALIEREREQESVCVCVRAHAYLCLIMSLIEIRVCLCVGVCLYIHFRRKSFGKNFTPPTQSLAANKKESWYNRYVIVCAYVYVYKYDKIMHIA